MVTENREERGHHPAVLSREGTVMVIVDVQEKLLPYVVDKEQVTKNLVTLIKFARIMKIPILMTEHYPKGLGETVPEIKESLGSHAPIKKVIFSCCGSSEFMKTLDAMAPKRLMIAGIETHICITQTSLDAMHAGYEVHVIEDATSSRTKRDHDLGVEKMRHLGAVISSTEMAMYEIMERADTKEFKEVLQLVK